MRMILAVMVLAALVAGCGEKQEVKDTVFAPQVKALEKARSVEDKLKQGEEKNRAALKASENQNSEAGQKIQGY